jgi:putative endonuclease
VALKAPRRKVPILKMEYFTYILFSERLDKFYSGYTANIDKRIVEHNSGKSKFTKNGVPWKVIKIFTLDSKQEAIVLENKIKKRGCKRFLEDINSSSFK